MPRLTRPPGMPEGVARVVELISNAVRTEILRHAAVAPITAVELSHATGVVHSSIYRHLVHLEAAGLVKADHEPQHRRGREVRWSVCPDRVREVADFWVAYATGLDPEGPQDG